LINGPNQKGLERIPTQGRVLTLGLIKNNQLSTTCFLKGSRKPGDVEVAGFEPASKQPSLAASSKERELKYLKYNIFIVKSTIKKLIKC